MKQLLSLTVLAFSLFVSAAAPTDAKAQLVIGRGGVQYYGRGQGYYGGYGRGYGGGYGYSARQYQGYGNGGYYNGYGNGGYYGRAYAPIYRPYGYGSYYGYGRGW